MDQTSTRAGEFKTQPAGFATFIPAPLPPIPEIKLDVELMGLLSKADRALGRLDGILSILPNLDLFVQMYARHESVLSSQIEGTESTLEDVLGYESRLKPFGKSSDVIEVYNHVQALNYGIERLATLPLSLRLIREVHKRLLANVRGGEKMPGQFRKSQNWLGPGGCSIEDASFVPPSVADMNVSLDDLERYVHADQFTPTLILCGLVHAQFETIHPFNDGNGRLGRLLITFVLCERKILLKPVLYLSHYFKANRSEYYDRLQAIRLEGDWEGWLRFFLKGVSKVGNEAVETARGILDLKENHRALVFGKIGRSANLTKMIDLLYEHPLITVTMLRDLLGCAYGTANGYIRKLVQIGLLEEIRGLPRNRVFRYSPYLDLFRT